jgi:hypothetical protein
VPLRNENTTEKIPPSRIEVETIPGPLNTIQCGRIGSTTSIWKEIAKLTDELNKTVVPYGGRALQTEVLEIVHEEPAREK